MIEIQATGGKFVGDVLVFSSRLVRHFCKSVLSYKSFSHVARWLLIPNNLAQCFTYWSIKKS